MATPEEELMYGRFRQDIGLAADDEEGLSNDEAADIYAEAAETYTGVASLKAGTRVIALGRMMADSAKLTSYTQNNTREELDEVFKNLKSLEANWQSKLDRALANESVVARPGNRPPSFNTSVISGW